LSDFAPMDKVKIEKKFTKKYGPVVLWWDDVVELFVTVRESASDVEISTEAYKFSTLEALRTRSTAAPMPMVRRLWRRDTPPRA
jgi:hypothetical protein